ncbi:MAG TPA: hypothetical protein VNH22_09430 [Blastocatellia bacterium]|jgi:hypothetical protein|nr:hypothetical protein [Blastocatellia bacterium]
MPEMTGTDAKQKSVVKIVIILSVIVEAVVIITAILFKLRA